MNGDGDNSFIEFLAMLFVGGGLAVSALTGVERWVDREVDHLKDAADRVAQSAPGASTGCASARAIDGDTISVVCDGERVTVRMIGFDTPESKRPGVPVECLSKQAGASLAGMVDGRRVKLVSDPSQGDRDRYGRALAYVEVGGKDVGRAQLRNGFARVYVYKNKPFARLRSYRAAERAAERQGAGLWRACDGSNHAQ